MEKLLTSEQEQECKLLAEQKHISLKGRGWRRN
jgi:hypothetical protein